MQKLNIINMLSSFIGFTEDDIITTINLYSTRYKLYKKEKKSGGMRTIRHPPQPLKALQYFVISSVLKKMQISDIAYAYVSGKVSPLREICDKHCKYKYTIRLDFKNFFPSICPENLFLELSKYYNLTQSDKKYLEKLLFFKLSGRYILPIGSPSSPVISNIVMFGFDTKIKDISSYLDDNSTVSRYADDVYFSTDKKNLCSLFHREIINLCEKINNPNLSLNERKTIYMSRGTKRVVCGLIATSDGKTSIGRSRKIFIKKQLHLFSSGSLSKEDIISLKGYLAFVKDCEPDFYSRLIIKYGADILDIKC